MKTMKLFTKNSKLSLFFTAFFTALTFTACNSSKTPSASGTNSQLTPLSAPHDEAEKNKKSKMAPRDATGPAQVYIIRHAEKPATGNDLDDQGYARADMLANFFQNDPQVTSYGPPAAIYAMAPSSDDGSMRPIETVTPLANALHLPIIQEYTEMQFPAMVADITSNASYAGQAVLICWEHKEISSIALSFSWGIFANVPKKWSGQVFDQVWILSLSNGQVNNFQIITQPPVPAPAAN